MRKLHGKKRQAKILVVDNDRSIALTLTEILAEQGYEVATVFSGKQAIVKAAEFLPDLLLSDLNMEEMNGVEAATRITAILPDCSVLFLSGEASNAGMLLSAPKRLVYSLILKPPSWLDLLNAIAYMLPAGSTERDAAETIAEHAFQDRHALARNLSETEVISWLVETESGRSRSSQSMPDAVFC